jgi:uncharacterized cupin superfamily protein
MAARRGQLLRGRWATTAPAARWTVPQVPGRVAVNMGLLPLRFDAVTDFSAAIGGIVTHQALANPRGSVGAMIAAPGAAPAGGASLEMGAWGAQQGAIAAVPFDQPAAEWCAVTSGSVTTVNPDGTKNTFTTGDVFVVPKGIQYTWKQSDDMSKFYVIVDHAPPEEAPTAIIPYDRAQPCEDAQEWWFFCEVRI